MEDLMEKIGITRYKIINQFDRPLKNISECNNPFSKEGMSTFILQRLSIVIFNQGWRVRITIIIPIVEEGLTFSFITSCVLSAGPGLINPVRVILTRSFRERVAKNTK